MIGVDGPLQFGPVSIWIGKSDSVSVQPISASFGI